MIVAILILLGLCFGSFVNALVWRIHAQSEAGNEPKKTGKKDLSILRGRSMCVFCGHTLQARDLVPVWSWLSLYGRCRYCHKRISWQYPFIEVITPVLFVLSYVYWPTTFDTSGILNFAVWLIALTGLIALIVYDIRWMLLPNRIIFPLIVVTAIGTVADSVISQSADILVSSLLGALIGGGIFYVLFQLSKGKWIGGGDVKLGLLLGLLVGDPEKALLVLFLASLVGTAFALPLMLFKRIPPKARIPFGPFLIIAAFITEIFGQQIIDWYLRIVGL